MTEQSGDPKAKRLLKTLFLLQSGRRYDISRLATELSVSRRTVFRDIATLKSAGVPIDYDAAHSFVVADVLPRCEGALLYADLALLVVAALSSSRSELPNAAEELAGAISRVAGTFGADLQSSVSQLTKRVAIENAAAVGAPVSPRADVIVALATGLSYERRVRLVLEDPERGVEWRFRFSPYQLRLHGEGWTAIGGAEVHPKPCRIAVARVVAASVTDEAYAYPLDLPRDEEIEWL